MYKSQLQNSGLFCKSDIHLHNFLNFLLWIESLLPCSWALHKDPLHRQLYVWDSSFPLCAESSGAIVWLVQRVFCFLPRIEGELCMQVSFLTKFLWHYVSKHKFNWKQSLILILFFLQWILNSWETLCPWQACLFLWHQLHPQYPQLQVRILQVHVLVCPHY